MKVNKHKLIIFRHKVHNSLKQILEKLIKTHLNKDNSNHNFNEEFKRNIDRKVKNILENIDLLHTQDKNFHTLNSDLSIKEVEKAIDNLNGSGSPGPSSCSNTDPGLPPLVLKLGKEIISPFLFHLIKILWKH